MITAAVIFGVAYLCIAAGRIPHAVIAVVGAAIMVFAQVLSPEQAFHHVDLEVIVLLAGMMVLASIIARTGAFDWAAVRGAHLVLARGGGFGLMVLLVAITAVASALLDNVTTVVIMVPITMSLCRSLDLDPVPFLLGEVFASNIGGTATIVGDPPNIIVASAADIGFSEFLVNMLPASAFSMAVLLGLLYLWFHKEIRIPDETRRRMMHTAPVEAIRDVSLLAKSLFVFALTIAAFFTHDLIGVSPAIVALAGAGLLMLISRLDPGEVLRDVEWTTLAFFTGLFILIGGMAEAGVIERLQDWILDVSGGSELNLAMLLVFVGGALSAIIDNIPFTATMSQVVANIAGNDGSGTINPLWWALTLGADLGGNLTIVGASANVVVVTMARSLGHPISFMRFLRYGIVIGAASLAISGLYVWLRYYY